MIEKRRPVFIERLSYMLVSFSALGATLVLLDPVVSFQVGAVEVKLGGEGFAEQMKGGVIMLVLIGGFTTVLTYWLGSSKSGDVAQQSVITTAQASVPAAAAAVAAARADPVPPGAPLPGKVGDVQIDAETVSVTTQTDPGKPSTVAPQS